MKKFKDVIKQAAEEKEAVKRWLSGAGSDCTLHVGLGYIFKANKAVVDYFVDTLKSLKLSITSTPFARGVDIIDVLDERSTQGSLRSLEVEHAYENLQNVGDLPVISMKDLRDLRKRLNSLSDYSERRSVFITFLTYRTSYIYA